jgi:hypothetical protein
MAGERVWANHYSRLRLTELDRPVSATSPCTRKNLAWWCWDVKPD